MTSESLPVRWKKKKMTEGPHARSVWAAHQCVGKRQAPKPDRPGSEAWSITARRVTWECFHMELWAQFLHLWNRGDNSTSTLGRCERYRRSSGPKVQGPCLAHSEGSDTRSSCRLKVGPSICIWKVLHSDSHLQTWGPGGEAALKGLFPVCSIRCQVTTGYDHQQVEPGPLSVLWLGGIWENTFPPNHRLTQELRHRDTGGKKIHLLRCWLHSSRLPPQNCSIMNAVYNIHIWTSGGLMYF